MTKDELEKEATEFEENYTVYEVAKRKDGSDYAKKVCNVTVKEAYLAGAEPREKRIADLERKLEQTEKDLTDYQFNYPKIKDLEKENAVLKEHIEMDCIDCVDYIKNRKLEKKLEQAKELLRRSYDNYISMQPLRGEIEKFLKE